MYAKKREHDVRRIRDRLFHPVQDRVGDVGVLHHDRDATGGDDDERGAEEVGRAGDDRVHDAFLAEPGDEADDDRGDEEQHRRFGEVEVAERPQRELGVKLDAALDAAQGRAPHQGRRHRLAPQRPEDLDDVRALRRVVLGRRPHRPRRASTAASRCSSCRSTSPASRSTASGRWATSAPTRSSSTTCSCPTTTWSARSTSGFQYISPGARPRALHDVHVLADQAAPRPALRLRARRASVDGEPLKDDPVVRSAHRAARHRGRGRARARACASSPRR